MNTEIIYTDILKDCEVYAELREGTLYVLLKEELRKDTIKTDLIISQIIRKVSK